MSQLGRPLPAVDVGYPAAQVQGQLSGGEIGCPTGACRPWRDIGRPDLAALKLPVGQPRSHP